LALNLIEGFETTSNLGIELSQIRKALFLKYVDLFNFISIFNFTAKTLRTQRIDTFLLPLRGRQKKNIQSLCDIFGF
jgi:hypothetical protein